VVLALALLPLLPALSALADSGSGVRILYPPSRSALPDGPVRMIVAAPLSLRLSGTLDGRPLTLSRLAFADTWQTPGRLKVTDALIGDRSAAALWVASISLAPGNHTVVVGGQRLELCRPKGQAPAGWTDFYAHRLTTNAKLDCSGCHEITDGALGSAHTPDACAGCHDEGSVQLIHRHVSEPLGNCAMCHDPHGTSRPKMLQDTKEKLCSRCHEAGHSKG